MKCSEMPGMNWSTSSWSGLRAIGITTVRRLRTCRQGRDLGFALRHSTGCGTSALSDELDLAVVRLLGHLHEGSAFLGAGSEHPGRAQAQAGQRVSVENRRNRAMVKRVPPSVEV